jgi:hypothetical protein
MFPRHVCDEFRDFCRTAPRERNASSSMAIVVEQQTIRGEPFRFDAHSRTHRAQSAHD